MRSAHAFQLLFVLFVRFIVLARLVLLFLVIKFTKTRAPPPSSLTRRTSAFEPEYQQQVRQPRA